MKTVSIVVPKGNTILSSIIGPYKVFKGVNDYLEQRGKQPAFKIQLVGITADTILYDGLFSVHPNVILSDTTHSDLIIIPALNPASLGENQPFVQWINEEYKRGAEIASLCVGAFLLASTGLMKGRNCTTHWMAADNFRHMFPDVKLIADKIITDENGIYTSGGAYSFLNLILYLVEKNCGREVAVFCAKLFEIDIDRYSQSPFAIFMGQKDHEDEPIRNAQLFMENNVTGKISVDQLASMFSISRRNFERRFKKATANTPVEYLQRVKIEVAKKSLENTRGNINEVMYSIGYSDSKAFRTTFKKITGLSPLEYRRKYNRELAVS
ncbi:MAG: helix-turn-helix domain-containing protein [Taibaiella sp.]|nr:helix-turn-helix domain-containing protein [Taibaiella sp.]